MLIDPKQKKRSMGIIFNKQIMSSFHIKLCIRKSLLLFTSELNWMHIGLMMVILNILKFMKIRAMNAIQSAIVWPHSLHLTIFQNQMHIWHMWLEYLWSELAYPQIRAAKLLGVYFSEQSILTFKATGMPDKVGLSIKLLHRLAFLTHI